MSEHVILVAFCVDDDDWASAQTTLMQALISQGSMIKKQVDAGGPITSWWIAEDDRLDGSDNDSAVFVTKGFQGDASRGLLEADLTGPHNMR